VQQRRFRRGGVGAQLSGSHDHFRARDLSACRNLGIVGADVNLFDEPGGTTCVDGALDQASSADPPKVLAGHAFGAAACRNDCEHPRMRASCVCHKHGFLMWMERN
jgi:hypothetical protein